MADLSLFDLTDRVAIVTGGGNGISKAIALGYARAGAHVCVIDKVPGRAEGTAALIGELGRETMHGTGNVGYREVADEFVERVMDKFGRIDILVNGAGGMRTDDGLYYERSVEELLEEELDDVIRNNLKSAFFMCRAAGVSMKTHGKGSIINISSEDGSHPVPNRIPYGLSKAAVTNFTKSLAAEWASHGIRVNEIWPMAVTRPQEPRYTDPDNVEKLLAASMTKRFGTPEDHVGVAIFLASDASVWATGATYVCNGGRLR